MKTQKMWVIVALVVSCLVSVACESSRCRGGHGRHGYGSGHRTVAQQPVRVSFHVSGPYTEQEIASVVEMAKAQGGPPEVVRQRIQAALPEARVEIVSRGGGPTTDSGGVIRGRQVREPWFPGANCPPGIAEESVLGNYHLYGNRRGGGVRAGFSPSGNSYLEADPQTYVENVDGLYINAPRGRPMPFNARRH